MSQFRIKGIDQGVPDTWVFRLNQTGNQVGDDIDARDPNELAEALLDTQTVLLKTSTLSPSAILSSTSGIAERLTLLERTAGQATLQDVYRNGGTISVLTGKPLVFGSREEIKIDDSGNLSFNPLTMKVKGSGAACLSLTNSSITTALSDLLVGAISPGMNLSLSAAGVMSFKDNYLLSAITLSESGQTSLETSSQSLVGAINELKNSAFDVSLQAVYNQSSPPKILTNMSVGTIIFENSSPTATIDTFKVVGSQTVTKKLTTLELKVGANTSISDANGLSTPSVITPSIQVQNINSGLYDLKFQDKRLLVPLTEDGVTGLLTNKTSLVGAINELKASLDSIGGSQVYFGIEHNAETGAHGIITTQAPIGAGSVARIQVKDSSGIERFSITGDGATKTERLTVGGKDVLAALNQLATHLVDDGRSHTAIASHLIAANPHNTVKTLVGLIGDISFVSPNGSILFGTSGQSVVMQTVESTTLQSAYDRLATKQLVIPTASGLKFVDETSSETMMMLRNSSLLINRALSFEYTGALISALSDLTISAAANLGLSSTAGNIDIKASGTGKTTTIQDIAFSDNINKTINKGYGTSVLGALNVLAGALFTSVKNTLVDAIPEGTALTRSPTEEFWMPITTLHPANQFLSPAILDFYFTNQSRPILTKYSLASGITDLGQNAGTINIDIGATTSEWEIGEELFVAPLSCGKLNIVSIAGVTNNFNISINDGIANKIIIGLTSAPNTENGEFLIQTSSASSNINADKTRNNIIRTLNDLDFLRNSNWRDYRSAIGGEEATAILEFTANISAGDIFVITPHADSEGTSVTFTAVASPTLNNQFAVGRTIGESARNLAKAINKTTMFVDSAQTINGHRCFAEVDGKEIILKWFMPGLTGRETTLSSSSANILIRPFSGGTCEIEIYRQNLGSNTISIATTSQSAISSINIPAHTTTSQFVMGKTIKSISRNIKNEKLLKVGKILSVAGTMASIRIEA